MLAPTRRFCSPSRTFEWDFVGAAQYTLNVESCPINFYDDGNGACVSCPEHVQCPAGSTISDWQLGEGYWRAGDQYTQVLKCRFGLDSCPGAAGSTNDDGMDCSTSTEEPYCRCGYTGPLCSECDANSPDGRFHMAWASGKCESCSDGMSYAPSIGLASGLSAVVLLMVSLAFTKRKRITSSRAYKLITRIYRIGKTKLSIVLFAFQARPLSRMLM